MEIDQLLEGLRVNKDDSSKTLNLLMPLKKAIVEMPPAELLQLLSGVLGALPSIVALAFQKGPDSLAIWKTIIELRDELAKMAEKISHPGILLRISRTMQLLAILLARPSTSQGTQEESQWAEDNYLDNEGGLKGVRNARDEEGLNCAEMLVGILWKQTASLSVRLGVINLLGRLGKQRPNYLSKIIPALIGQSEAEAEDGPYASIHQRMLYHTLELQLEGLMEVGAAEKYAPLIVDSLKKLEHRSVSPTGVTGKGGKRYRATADGEVDEEEDLELSMVGAKKKRTEEARLFLASTSLNTTQVPLNIATEVVLRTLVSLSMSQIKAAIETWKPTLVTPVPSTPRSTTRDPRRAPIQRDIGSKLSGTLKEPTTARGADQVVPFNLQARPISEREMQSLLHNRIPSLLKESFTIEGGVRKCMARICFTLSQLQTEGFEILDTSIIDFCFEENVLDRVEFLIDWLGQIWGHNVVENPGMDDDNPGATYIRIYSQCVQKLYQLILDAQSPEWPELLKHFFIKVPQIYGDDHLQLIRWICESIEYRNLGIQVVETLMIKRPAVTLRLVGMLVDLFNSTEDDSVKNMITRAFLPLLRQPDHADQIISIAKNKLMAQEREGEGFDLALEIAIKSPEVWDELCRMYPQYSLTAEQHLIQSLSSLGHSMDESFVRQLLKYPIQETPLGVFLERAFELAVKNDALKDQDELVVAILECLLEGNWPIRLLDRVIPFASNLESQSLSSIILFVNTVDPNQELQRPPALALLTKCADRFGGDRLLILLHQLHGQVSLKRLVDYIQICLNFLKPEIIADTLKNLVPTPLQEGNEELLQRLPPMILRTLIQSYLLHKNLVGVIVGLLARLVGLEIWKSRLWEGFERCVRTLGVASFAVLLQLPEDRLKEVLLTGQTEFREAFLTYLAQQSIAIRNRFPSLLTEPMES